MDEYIARTDWRRGMSVADARLDAQDENRDRHGKQLVGAIRSRSCYGYAANSHGRISRYRRHQPPAGLRHRKTTRFDRPGMGCLWPMRWDAMRGECVYIYLARLVPIPDAPIISAN